MIYLKSVDFSNFISNSLSDIHYLFYKCISLESVVDLSGLDTSKITNMGFMFCGCSSLKSIDLSNFNTSKVSDMKAMFSGCKSLKSIDLSHFDTSKVIYMNSMFSDCALLQSIDLSYFETSKVTDMSWMFSGCSSLKYIGLSNFDTSLVTDIKHMFYDCYSIKSIDLSNFDTSRVVDMKNMFYDCYSLKSIDLSNFDTTLVTDMGNMFSKCYYLESIDLSNFNTLHVTSMNYMFSECNLLKSIDISHFDMSNCNSYDNMFSDINNIRYINLYYLKNDKIISDTFKNINNPIFICQKDNIIDNPKAYNCCNSNFQTYECISPTISNTINTKTNIIIPLDTTNPIQSDNYISYQNIKSSSSISTGVIIGIIIASIAIVAAVTIIIICCKCGYLCKKNISNSSKDLTNINISNGNENNTKNEINKSKINQSIPERDSSHGYITNTLKIKPNIDNLQNNNGKIIEYKPEIHKDNLTKVIFENPGFGDTNILIDTMNTIDELIRFYFEINGRLDLYGDESIIFLIDGNCIQFPYPKKPIKTLINTVVKSQTIKICVNDSNDKMK